MTNTYQPARGTRIIQGADAILRRRIINRCVEIAERMGFGEIVMPSVEYPAVYTDQAGPEILGQMYTFPDRKGRTLCLRPEVTATIRAAGPWPADTLVWYCERCWRYERPQAGRYREFTQFGVEWLSPTRPIGKVMDYLVGMAEAMVRPWASGESDLGASRGLAYYTGGVGFEIRVPSLGAQKQVVGGGAYEGGAGFALGVDRLMLAASGDA